FFVAVKGDGCTAGVVPRQKTGTKSRESLRVCRAVAGCFVSSARPGSSGVSSRIQALESGYRARHGRCRAACRLAPKCGASPRKRKGEKKRGQKEKGSEMTNDIFYNFPL